MKSLRSAAVVVALLVFACNVLAKERVGELRAATPEELAMSSVPFAPGAPAVILDWTQWRDDVDATETEYVRIKILSEEGKRYGDISIPYVPLLANIGKIEARVTRPDGAVVPFNGNVFEKLIMRAGGLRMICKTLTLPDVQPGSIVEYRYTLALRGSVVYGKRFTVQRELPVVRETVGLRPHQAIYHFFGFRGLPPGKKPEMNGDHYELTLDNVPAFEAESFAPPESEVKPLVNFYYVAERMDPEQFWKKTGKELTAFVEDFISGDPAPIHNAAADAVAGAPSADERLRRLYAVTQKIRNLSYETDKTAAEERKLKDNHSAQDVLRNGYGYAGEINRLFIALARSAGFEANAVRVASRDDAFFARKVPVAAQLDSEVALVKIGDQELVLDPGTPNAPYGVVAWQKERVPGLKLVKKQDSAWYETPELRPEDAVITRKAVLQVDGDALKGKVVVTYKGQEALVRRLRNYNDDDAATKKSLERGMKGRFPEGATVTLTRVSGMKSPDAEVVAEYDVELPNAGSFAGSRTMIPPAIFHSTHKNPFAPTTRHAPVYFEYPWIEEDDITLEVPSGYAVETMPSGTSVDANGVAYTTTFETSGDRVHYTRRYIVDAMFVPREHYEQMRTAYSRIFSADQEQVILRRVPTKAAAAE